MAREASREGKTPLNGELARRLNALYSNPKFNWNERHSIKSIWTALEDVHTSIRTVPSHDNFHWLYNLHRHWCWHEGCVCSTMGFSTYLVYYLLVQNSYHVLVIRKELNNLKTFSFKTNVRGTLGCCDKIGGNQKIVISNNYKLDATISKNYTTTEITKIKESKNGSKRTPFSQ